MYTYQDLVAVGDDGRNKIDFIVRAIQEHKNSDLYKVAEEAEEYDRKKNRTITQFSKFMYNLYGERVIDQFSTNYKIISGFFPRAITQENQYLLGNGVSLTDASNKEKLGKNFDIQLQILGRKALVHAVAYGFWNLDHLEVFDVFEFSPLMDEETGQLTAGIRFWQIDEDKPLRVTLYEPDGYTDYIKYKGTEMVVKTEKRAYKRTVAVSAVEGERIISAENYKSFPIVPMWGNPHHQSEIIGVKSGIDAYDLIKSGFANDLNDASLIYWTLENAGGMRDIDLVKFVEHMKTVRAANVDGDDGAKATAHTTDVPYQAHETFLNRIERDLYKDFCALDIDSISSGNKTATEINAAYEPLNSKVDQYEYCVLQFLERIFELAGVDDEPSFVRSRIVNQLEDTQMVMTAAQHLDDETILRKLPWLTPEEVDEILKRRDAEDVERMTGFGGMPEV